MDIQGKVIIVTGASSGIGLATARALGQAGAQVVLAARDDQRLGALTNEIAGSRTHRTDVTVAKQAKALIDNTTAEFGRIDGLINCAGRGMFARVEDIDLDDFRQLLELNVVAPLRLMQLALPVMKEHGGGAILNVSSLASTKYIPNIAGYAATKYALNALSLTARAELVGDNVVVSVVRPGVVDSEFGANATTAEPDALRRGADGRLLPHVISPETVAAKIIDLLRSGEAELDIVEP